jgi:hypothetical protein
MAASVTASFVNSDSVVMTSGPDGVREEMTSLVVRHWRVVMATVLSIIIAVGTLSNVASCAVFVRLLYGNKRRSASPAASSSYSTYTVCLLILAVADTVMLAWILSQRCTDLLHPGTLLTSHRVYCITYHVTRNTIIDFTTLLIVATVLFASRRHIRHLSSFSSLKDVTSSCVCITLVVLLLVSVAGNAFIGPCIDFRIGELCLNGCVGLTLIVLLAKTCVEQAAVFGLCIFLAYYTLLSGREKSSAGLHSLSTNVKVSTSSAQKPEVSSTEAGILALESIESQRTGSSGGGGGDNVAEKRINDSDNSKSNHLDLAVESQITSENQTNEEHADNKQQSTRWRNDLMKTNFVLCAVFVVTHLPNFVLLPIFAYAYFFDRDLSYALVMDYDILYDSAFLVWCSNFALKFFIYLATLPNFRRHLTELFLCRQLV